MNLIKLACISALATATVAAMGQGLTTRIFTYDGTQGTNGLATWQVNGDGVNAAVFSGYVAGSTYGQNGVSGSSYTNAQFLEQTLINVSTYVYISGNFGGVYNVQGIGTASDITQTNDVEVRTNRTLSFTASGFYGIGVNLGHVDYAISLFQDYPSNGVQIGPTITGTDAGFNGSTVYVNPGANLPADGRATLRLTRTLNLSQAAVGGQTYTVAGFIAVGVN
ncbi:MAG: hypothetical protein P4L46_07250 [Fimbriimonas sp.]|nr:hypothetical protein [Fimbriimonas sp.]